MDILIIVVVVALCAVAVFKFGVVNQKESAGVDASEEQRTYTAPVSYTHLAASGEEITAELLPLFRAYGIEKIEVVKE